MRKLMLITFTVGLPLLIWSQRVSPKDGFFSVEPPQGWNPLPMVDVLRWDSPDVHAQITASLLSERGSFSETRKTFENEGFQITSSEERMFHGFRCRYAYGENSSRNEKGTIYFCQVRRGDQRWSTFLFYTVDSKYETSYSTTLDRFLNSFQWNNDVKDDH